MILQPSGVNDATIGPPTTTPDQAEWFNDNHDHLGDQHDPTNAAHGGADRWNMSVRDYGRFIAHLTHGQLHPNPWPTMQHPRAGSVRNPAELPHWRRPSRRLAVPRSRRDTQLLRTQRWMERRVHRLDGVSLGATVAFFANSTLVGDEQEKMILDSWLAAYNLPYLIVPMLTGLRMWRPYPFGGSSPG
jgi:hypothetical protein